MSLSQPNNEQTLPRIFSARLEHYCAVLLLVFSLVFVLLFGVIGFMRGGELGFDFIVFHEAGITFLQGINPWLHAIGSGAPFSYPPHIGSLVAFYGVLPFSLALGIHTALNFASILLIAYLANIWFINVRDWRNISLAQGLCLAVIVGNPFNAHSIYEGQWTLIATALAFLCWHLIHKEKLILAGVCLAFVTIKPQVALLFVVFLLCRGQIKTLAVGAAIAVLMMLPTLVNFGLVDTFGAWFASMKDYAKWPANQPGSPHVVGLEGFLMSLGVNGSGIALKIIAVASAVVLVFRRENVSPVLQVNFLLASMLTFYYGHDTDYVSLSLLWSYFLLLAMQSRSIANFAIAGGILLVIVFPQRFIRALDIEVLFHTRTLAIIGVCLLAYVWEKKLITAAFLMQNHGERKS